MAITLTQQESDEFLTNGHTLIFTCLDKDGYPHTTPLWYVYMDGHVSLRARSKSQKAKNLTRSQKVSAMVETGDRWVDLKAVMIRGHTEEILDEESHRRYDKLLAEKYAPFQAPRAAMPGKVQAHYSTSRVYYRVIPDKKLATWDNQKIRMKSA